MRTFALALWRICVGLLLSGAAVVFVGCGVGAPASQPALGPAITGIVHGGQQPVGSSKVYLYEAGTTGYGSGAQSLLNGAGYVTTDPETGSFSITGDYSCTSESSLVYLVAVGGNPGLMPASTNNPNLALMAALGPCSYWNGTSYTANPAQAVVINEVTTVASVYALAQFMTPGTYQVGTSSTNVTGLTNAFATVNNLVDISTGMALVTTPSGTGTIPQKKINSLADILASCVNSSGGMGACSALFTDTMPPSGSVASDTIGAALNIALYPGNNVVTLNGLVSPTAPFQPNLTYSNGNNANASPPSDWTIAPTFAFGNIDGSSITHLAVDAGGNVWACSSAGTFGSVALRGVSSIGTVLTGAAGFSGPGYTGSFTSCSKPAIDPAGDIWIGVTSSTTNDGHGLVEFSSSGTITPSTGSYATSYIPNPTDIAFDHAGNLWVSDFEDGIDGDGAMYFNTSGTSLSPMYSIGTGHVAPSSNGTTWTGSDTSGNIALLSPASGGYSSASITVCANNSFGVRALVADGSGGVWVLCESDTIGHVSSSGTVATYAGGSHLFEGGVLDGAGDIWIGGDGVAGILEFNANGTLLSTSASVGIVTSGSGQGINDMEIDSSGNLWVVTSAGTVYEDIGGAPPVITPRVVALQSGKLGQMP